MKLIFQKGLCPLWQMVSSSFYPTEGPYFSYSVPLIMQHTHTRSAVRGYKECRPQKYLSFRGISFALASHGEICGTVLCTQSCPTLGNPMDYSLLDSSVHGIFQARILEWVAISFSRGSSRPRDWTRVSCVSCTGTWILYCWATREAQGHYLLLIVQSLSPVQLFATLWTTVRQASLSFTKVIIVFVSRVQLFVTPWTVACQTPLPLRFPRQEYWSGLPFMSKIDS